MLSDAIIVQSAVSAFNNMALVTPAFLWCAALALPLFIVIYWCKDIILARIGWNRENILNRTTTWMAGLTLCWVVLFGGNYAVLRDTLSVLPMMVATVVFLTSLFVSSHLRHIRLPVKQWRFWALVISILIIVGLSDMHAWWGPLLQIGALCTGWILGRFAKADMRPYSGAILIILATTVAILMQPEFWRFGQLGNLGVAHLVTILIIGTTAMATIAVQNTNARGRIKPSMFIKAKWLARVICALGCALFILTEAVPVFIGTMIAMYISFSMSVWHAKVVNKQIADKMFAIVLITFGIITIMPVITCMGILFWCNNNCEHLWQESKFLL